MNLEDSKKHMENLNNYWQKYPNVSDSTSSDYYTGDIIPYDYWHPYRYTYTYSPPENKTEQAFKILKLLVEEKIIREPGSFKRFCSLIEKISKVI